MKRSLRWGGRSSVLLAALICGFAWAHAPAAWGADGLEALSIDPAWVVKNTAPASAPARIRGFGFTPATAVTFDGVAATVTFVDSRTLQVLVPTSATGKAATILVTDGSRSDRIFPFMYTDLALYVKPTGNDQSNGTTPALAKKTIGGALGAASTTTTTLIRVAEGVYLEGGLAMFSGVVLTGGWDATFTTRDPDQFVTVVDAGGAGFALRSAGLASNQVVDGLTVRNGVREGLGGGALVISGDNTVLTNSVLVGNTTSARGGGVYATFTTSYGGSPIISSNVLLGNRSYANTGGGIAIYPFYTQGQVLDVAVSDNFILGNRSFNNRGGGLGLGTQTLYTYNNLRLQVVGNILGDNRAVSGAGAAFIAAGAGDRYDLLFDNNLVFGNAAIGEAGGLLLSGVGRFTGRISGTTVAGNSAGTDGGGGIRFSASPIYEGGFEVENLIVAGNSNGNLSGMALPTYSLIEGGAPGTGNISANPDFVSGPMGMFYLAQDANTISPAVDAGSGPADLQSMEGRTTSIALSPDDGMVDMGFHYPAGLAPSPDPLVFGRIDPARGDVGGADWVLIRGKGFDPGITAEFDGLAAADLIYVSPTRLLARPAAHSAGNVSVTLRNPDLTTVSQPSGYAYVDNVPPMWPTTVGLQSVATRQDCVRSATLNWNAAADLLTPPVRYTIYREDCVANTGNFQNPCSNFGYFPSAMNRVGSTSNNFWVDTDFGTGGADPRVIYLVRAADAAAPPNSEYNYSKRLVTVGKITTDTIPPSPVGNTLDLVAPDTLDWAGAKGAVSYRVYRETVASAYASAVTPFITLTTANNDLDADLVTDTQWTDAGLPGAGVCFFYKVSALDPCNIESTSDLLP